MPTPRKSRAELALSGTLQRNPARYSARFDAIPAVIEPIGRAPAHLQDAERRIWTALVRHAPPGLWNRSDRLALEVVVRLILKMRQPDATTRDYTALAGILGRMGLTPVARRQMGYEPPSKLAVIDPAWDALDELD